MMSQLEPQGQATSAQEQGSTDTPKTVDMDSSPMMEPPLGERTWEMEYEAMEQEERTRIRAIVEGAEWRPLRRRWKRRIRLSKNESEAANQGPDTETMAKAVAARACEILRRVPLRSHLCMRRAIDLPYGSVSWNVLHRSGVKYLAMSDSSWFPFAV